jgi:Protein of unknown function (DUF3551)
MVGACAAALLAAASSGQARGKLAYCLLTEGATECIYPTLAACESTRTGEGGECVPNPRVAGAGGPPAAAPPAAPGKLGTQQPFCIKTEGTTECLYRTLAACEHTRAGEGGECVPNPR